MSDIVESAARFTTFAGVVGFVVGFGAASVGFVFNLIASLAPGVARLIAAFG